MLSENGMDLNAVVHLAISSQSFETGWFYAVHLLNVSHFYTRQP